MRRFLSCLFLVLAPGACAWAAEVVVEKYEDGTPKRRFAVDGAGRKDGPFTEYFPTGKVKVRATYKAGKLDGAYTENSEEGAKALTALYRADKLHGTLTQYWKGRTVLTQPFQDGKLIHPKGLDDIRKTIKEILTPPDEKAGNSLDADRQAALRLLKAYRYLVDVPYANLTFDDDMTEAAQAAAKICAKLNRLDHTPKNPDWPEDEYKLAYKGTTHSNLAMGFNGTLVRSVSEWMHDSDDSNVSRLGHRRWCINPPLQKTGFGKSGQFMAMWAFDRSQPKVPDYSFVGYPARGLMPIEFFRSTAAWSVSLNPKKYRKPGKSAAAKIYAVDKLLRKVGEPLKLNYRNVDTTPFGIPYCVIFRPEKKAVAAGQRYLVEIEGLTRSDGGPTVLRYVVEFARLK